MGHDKAEQAYDAGTLRLGRVLLAIDARMESYTLKTGISIQDIRAITPAQTGGGWKLVVRGWAEDGRRFVAFHDAETYDAAMSGLEAKLRDIGFQWYDDVPYAERKAGEKLKRSDVG